MYGEIIILDSLKIKFASNLSLSGTEELTSVQTDPQG